MIASTRRALRTAFHGLMAAVVVIPTLAAVLPTSTGRITEVVGATVAAAAVVAKVVNLLEDKGLIPAWLKGEPVDPAAADGGAPAVANATGTATATSAVTADATVTATDATGGDAAP